MVADANATLSEALLIFWYLGNAEKVSSSGQLRGVGRRADGMHRLIEWNQRRSSWIFISHLLLVLVFNQCIVMSVCEITKMQQKGWRVQATFTGLLVHFLIRQWLHQNLYKHIISATQSPNVNSTVGALVTSALPLGHCLSGILGYNPRVNT